MKNEGTFFWYLGIFFVWLGFTLMFTKDELEKIGGLFESMKEKVRHG